MNTYTRDDIKQALQGAGLPSYVRHAVYSNLPAKAKAKPDLPPKFVQPGNACENVYLTDLNGNVHEGRMVVAACSDHAEAKFRKHITFWRASALAKYGLTGSAVKAKYEDVRIDNAPLGGVE